MRMRIQDATYENKGKQKLKPVAGMGSICRWLSLKEKIIEITNQLVQVDMPIAMLRICYLDIFRIFMKSLNLSSLAIYRSEETHPALNPSKQ
jgi:hypothetical protein